MIKVRLGLWFAGHCVFFASGNSTHACPRDPRALRINRKFNKKKKAEGTGNRTRDTDTLIWPSIVVVHKQT
ncbi:hypothetical protein L873DRAFT_1804541 [Choiromyces venosus 120613-1]|uniref:Secreted protein n=1 Tax=Choiromyces venosus 120613-1 TaxID=1336337 RepID=A0A3N4JUD2_9PEZI|nr:hypothetical protein L873DRAFT_1804541 [Choiromyces venosus 120613-1]